MAEQKKDRVGLMRENFESKYGSPTGSGKVLIGMKSGKAVYGDELDAVDTSGKNVINNTYSQNQAIMNDMFKEMAQSGGMYNPSTKDIAAAERMSPVTAADKTVTRRSDGTDMVGAYSPQAAAMREPSSSDAQFLKTLNRLNERENKTSKFSDTDPFPSKLPPTKPPVSQGPTPPPQPSTGSSLDNVALAGGITTAPPQNPFVMDRNNKTRSISGVDQNSLFEAMAAFGIDPSEWGYR